MKNGKLVFRKSVPTAPAEGELQDACRRGGRLFVSPITAWEIAMPASVLVASTTLPATPPHDAADRIIIATARALRGTYSRRVTRGSWSTALRVTCASLDADAAAATDN